MSHRKKLIVSLVLLISLSTGVSAFQWAQPYPRIFAQPQGGAAFKVMPDGKGTYFRLDESGKEKGIWETKLVNIPGRVIVSEFRDHVITYDTWGGTGSGYEHALVIYGEKGKVIADFKLDDLLTAKELKSFPESEALKALRQHCPWWWNKETTEIIDDSRLDELVIRFKLKDWSKVIRVTLSTGKLVKE